MIRLSIAVAAAAATAIPAGAADAPNLSARAAAVVAALSDGERDEARWGFDDSERHDVHYAPFGLDGIAHGDLAPGGSSLVDSLLATALSARGMQTVRDVRNLELAVQEKERSRWFSFATRSLRDPGRYLLALFGEPDDAGPWAFRYEGHHLSLNVTRVPGRALATTPLFLGAEPRVVPQGWPSAGVAVLGEEERLARAIHAALPRGLRERARLPYDDDRGLMLGQVARLSNPGDAAGVARREMPERAAAMLDELVERFVGLWSADAAQARRREIAAGRDALHFAYADHEDPSGAFYVRIQGPRLLIEIDNTTDGDHVHAVWHDLEGDFGEDVLARHWREQHGVSLAGRRSLRRLALGERAAEP